MLLKLWAGKWELQQGLEEDGASHESAADLPWELMQVALDLDFSAPGFSWS